VSYMSKVMLLPLLVFTLILSAGGCGKNEARHKESPVLAKINNYELTTEDFRDEIRLTAHNKELPVDIQQAKERLLDEIIMKKVLLQEAQRQNFDKDMEFTKEIERYWEQALLKLLMKKKMTELSREITVKDSEVREEYERLSLEAGGKIDAFEVQEGEIKEDINNRKMQALFDSWLKKLKKDSDVKIYKENL
jgi:hypothetical protein